MTTTTTPSPSDYSRAELDTVVSVDLTLGQLLSLRGSAASSLAAEERRRAKQERKCGEFVPELGRVNSIAAAIGRKTALVEALDEAIDRIDDQLEDQ